MADPLSHHADVVATKPMTVSSLFNVVMEAKSRLGLLKPRMVSEPEGKRLAGIRVMVVDDSEINRDVALDILEGEGARVDVANDGAEALIRLSSDPGNYDVVLMDVQMPVMDGYEATRQIRLHPLLKHLPVIALTAGALKNQQDTALQRGMDAFVPKPFEVEQLLSTIVRLVKGHAPVAVEGSADTGLNVMGLFDMDAAQRKWRRPETLVRHLQTFVQEHAVDAVRMLAQLQAGQMQELMAVAHKLRGAAGALSLQRCMALATNVEESVLLNTDTQQIGEWLEELHQVLQATALCIADYLQTQAAAPARPPARDRVPAPQGDTVLRAQNQRALLEKLRLAVRTDDPAQVEQHLPAVAELMPEADLKGLQTLLDKFDFEGVSQWIAMYQLEPGIST
jgi:CheY-like chemotaxis protein